MKIRVLDTDGEFRGGLLKTHMICRTTSRVWDAPPRADYFEQLVDYWKQGSWFRLLISRYPELIGPDDHSDDFDAASFAYRLSPQQAAVWMEQHGFPVPADLRQRVPRRATPSSPDEPRQFQPPLKPSHRAAYALYEFAMDINPSLNTDRDVYNWLTQRPEIPGELPKSFKTFRRYLSGARRSRGENKNSPRSGRSLPSNVVRRDQL